MYDLGTTVPYLPKTERMKEGRQAGTTTQHRTTNDDTKTLMIHYYLFVSSSIFTNSTSTQDVCTTMKIKQILIGRFSFIFMSLSLLTVFEKQMHRRLLQLPLRKSSRFCFVNAYPNDNPTGISNISTKRSNRHSGSLLPSDRANIGITRDYTTPDPKKLLSLMPECDKNGNPFTLYEKCVRRLYLTNLFHPVRLGLQNIEDLHSALGNPMDRSDITVIHVAGTNGKGSTSWKIARALELAGHTVGLFVSPHVASFRERMQVNSELISEDEVAEYLPLIYNICEEQQIPATFFEVTAALAFHFFGKKNVDVVVLETGLGGRLDATNVVKKPDLCVITSIALEHTRILGDTIELIAMEKAGIIKKDVPVLVGPNCPHETIRKCALEKEAADYYTCGDFEDARNQEHNHSDGSNFVDYDLENSMIARSALKILCDKQIKGDSKRKISISEEILKKGLAQRPPCRFEKITFHSAVSGKGVEVILDVAHNPDAIAYLVKKLAATYPELQEDKMRIVVGFSADKDLKVCGSTMLEFVSDPSQLHLVEAAHPRAATLEDMLDAAPLLRESNFDEEDRSITAQVHAALKLAEAKDEILIICGSVFLMAEARQAIGIDEARDSKYIADVAGANLRHGQEFFADQDPCKK